MFLHMLWTSQPPDSHTCPHREQQTTGGSQHAASLPECAPSCLNLNLKSRQNPAWSHCGRMLKSGHALTGHLCHGDLLSLQRYISRTVSTIHPIKILVETTEYQNHNFAVLSLTIWNKNRLSNSLCGWYLTPFRAVFWSQFFVGHVWNCPSQQTHFWPYNFTFHPKPRIFVSCFPYSRDNVSMKDASKKRFLIACGFWA